MDENSSLPGPRVPLLLQHNPVTVRRFLYQPEFHQDHKTHSRNFKQKELSTGSWVSAKKESELNQERPPAPRAKGLHTARCEESEHCCHHLESRNSRISLWSALPCKNSHLQKPTCLPLLPKEEEWPYPLPPSKCHMNVFLQDAVNSIHNLAIKYGKIGS